MVEPLSLAGAFMLGLAGSPHCLGMCGAISCLTGRAKAAPTLGFQLGRLGSYALLGALLGGLGASLSQQWLVVGLVFRLLASLLLIMMAVSLAGWFPATRGLERAGALVWRRLQPIAGKLLPADSLAKALGLGALWGLLPCGLIYSALAWATLAADPQQSALMMFSFGMGTLPAMLGIARAQGSLQRRLKHPGSRQVMAAFMLVMAVLPLNQLWSEDHHQHGATPTRAATSAAPMDGVHHHPAH